MLPNTLYIYITDSSLYFVKQAKGRDSNLQTAHCDINPGMPFAAVIDEFLAERQSMLEGADKVRVIVDSPSVLIPLAEFSEDTFREYYKYCIPSDYECRIFCDTLPVANAMLVFSVAENVYSILTDRFEKPYFCSSIAAISSNFMRKSSTQVAPKRILCALREEAIDIVAAEAGKLLLVNSFSVRATSDILYYTLATASKLGISAETDTFFIAGEEQAAKVAMEEFRKVVRNVRPYNLFEESDNSIALPKEPVPFAIQNFLVES